MNRHYIIREGNNAPREVSVGEWVKLERKGGFLNSEHPDQPATLGFNNSDQQIYGLIADTEGEIEKVMAHVLKWSEGVN